MHDPTQVLLGQIPFSLKQITVFDNDPAGFPAGVAVSKTSTADKISVLKSAGMRCGISLGASLSDIKKTAVARTGHDVPMRLSPKRATGAITVTAYANLVSGTDDVVTIGATAFTAQAGAATPGDPTFQAATNNNATATSLAAQINAHATASTLVYAVASSAVVNLYAKTAGVGSTGSGNDVAVAYTDNDTNVGITLAGLTGGKLAGGSDTYSDVAYVTKGSKVYINDVTGMADIAMSGFSTVSDATYTSAPLQGIAEDKSIVPAVLVSMPGGL